MDTRVIKNVICHQVDGPPAGWYCDKTQEFEDYEVEYLANRGISECWYWYRTEPYAGDGELIGKTSAGNWLLMDLSHCSCYGPTDQDNVTKFASLKELAEFPYQDRHDRILPLLVAAKEAA